MERLYPFAGWFTLGMGCFTLVVVLSPRHSGWPVSILMISTGWSFLHNQGKISPTVAPSDRPLGLRPLRKVLTLHLICLAVWGAALGLRLAQWGFLPSVGVQKGILCFGMALGVLAAHDLIYGRRWPQLILIFSLLAAQVPYFVWPSWFQLPAQESTAVQLGIAALAILYVALLVARRWMR